MIGIPGIPGTSNRTAIYILGGVLVALILAIVVGWQCYGSGYDKAKAQGEAKYNALVAEYQGRTAESLAKALDRAAKLTEAGNAISATLITTRADLAEARAELTRRIPDATADLPAACVFGADFVRLWNDLLGIPAAGVPQAAGPGGAAGRAKGSAAVDAGLRQGESVAATPADLLTHLRDYGQYCRDLAATATARRKLLEEWSK